MTEKAKVGVVLVSHSPVVAAAVADMALGLSGGGATGAVEPAGGTEGGELGTSSELIEAAVRRADAGAGVVVLADMGSSVLTVKTVLEDLADDAPEVTALLADAPFVEGTVSAVVTAAAGAGVQEVAAAATEAFDYRKR